jgi:hypothetical protein
LGDERTTVPFGTAVEKVEKPEVGAAPPGIPVVPVSKSLREIPVPQATRETPRKTPKRRVFIRFKIQKYFS